MRGFVPEGFCPRGVLSQRGFVLGGFVLEGFCPYTENISASHTTIACAMKTVRRTLFACGKLLDFLRYLTRVDEVDLSASCDVASVSPDNETWSQAIRVRRQNKYIADDEVPSFFSKPSDVLRRIGDEECNVCGEAWIRGHGR